MANERVWAIIASGEERKNDGSLNRWAFESFFPNDYGMEEAIEQTKKFIEQHELSDKGLIGIQVFKAKRES